ncbi:MAG TPA: YafY family protein [Tepidiformaceae bacterium]|nr:YafY family protein [Tepidiformaceae bacterium]
MRRADRLFQVIQLLRRRPVVTAAAIARELEVSERTVYRDIRDLVISGVPIDGEAGVGYTLRRGFDLPPLMFTAPEIEAMVLGVRVVTSWGDAALARAAGDALARVEAALPDWLKAKMAATPLYAPGFHVPQHVMTALSTIRAAIDERQKLRLDYTDASGTSTDRVVRPLGLFFWGSGWSMAAWCELRTGFRNFRLDRMVTIDVLGEHYEPEPGRNLDEFFAAMRDS